MILGNLYALKNAPLLLVPFSDTVQKHLKDRNWDGSASPGGELLKESFWV